MTQDTPDDTDPLTTRLMARKRLLMVLAATLLVFASGVVLAASFPGRTANDYEHFDNFEGDTVGAQADDPWDGFIASTSFEDNKSIKHPSTYDDELNFTSKTVVVYFRAYGEGGGESVKIGRPQLPNETALKMFTYGDIKYDDGTGETTVSTGCEDFEDDWKDYFVVLTPENNATVYSTTPNDPFGSPCLEDFSLTNASNSFVNISTTQTNSQIYIDEVGVGGGDVLWGTVTDEKYQAIPNATVTVTDANGNVVDSATTNNLGNYEIRVDAGTYNVTAAKSGYFDTTEEVTVNGSTQQDLILYEGNSSLAINTDGCLDHGDRRPYWVEFTNYTGGQNPTVKDVTDQATVTANNTTLVTVDTVTAEVIATNDTSTNGTTYIEAGYTAGNGDTYVQTRNVTVANHTVANLKENDCSWTRFESTMDDSNIFIILLATMIGAAVSIIATVFAGVSALTGVIVVGWIMDEVSDGIVIVAVLMGAWIGMNVAGQIDYQINRGG